MARRYIGNAVIEIEYKGGPRDEYVGTITIPTQSGRDRPVRWQFDGLFALQAGFGRHGFDSPEAYDQMAASAVSFGSYYTSHNRGDDVPAWAPSPEVADAIDEATSFALDDQGNATVSRKSPTAAAAGPQRRLERLLARAEKIDPNLRIYAGYSGRGMYGRTASQAFTSGIGPGSKTGQKLVKLGFAADSLGRDFIYYTRD